MAARKGDLILYSGDLFTTEAGELPACPREKIMSLQKGKPTHPLALLYDRCGLTKRLSSLALINVDAA